MLNIKTKTNGEFHLYVGQKSNLTLDFINEEIKYIVADGDELMYIVDKFINFPIRNKRTVTYFGDFAKFIVANW